MLVCKQSSAINVSRILIDNEKSPKYAQYDCACILNHSRTTGEALAQIPTQYVGNTAEFKIGNKTFKSNKDKGNITLPSSGNSLQIQYHQSDNFTNEAIQLEIVGKLTFLWIKT